MRLQPVADITDTAADSPVADVHAEIALARLTAAAICDLLLGASGRAAARLLVMVDRMPAPPPVPALLTLRPLSMWRRLFALAGYVVVAEDERSIVSDSESPTWSPRAHWHRLNPFREPGAGARTAFTLERTSRNINAATTRRVMLAMLGAPLACEIPPALFDEERHAVFVVGSYQEFRQYQPLWAQLPVASFSVIRRTGRNEPGWHEREQCMDEWFAARRISSSAVRSVAGVEWERWTHTRTTLVVGADSTAYDGHLWNGALILAARERRWRTVQLQHGIWPNAGQHQPMTMLSDTVLTWSTEFARQLMQQKAWPDGSVQPRATVTGVRFVSTGHPPFDRYAESPGVQLEDVLGDWVIRYRHRVLVATNLHWSQHGEGHRVNPAILDLASRMPDTLFLVKPHPVHDLDDEFLQACPENVQVLDEICSLLADVDSTRLVLATDGVVSTQSTVALEAALAGKPFLIVDTANPNSYEHVQATPVDQLPAGVAALLDEPRDAAAFRDHYFDMRVLGHGTQNVLNFLATDAPAASNLAPDVAAMALQRYAERLSTLMSEALEDATELKRLHTALTAAYAYADVLSRRHEVLSRLADAREELLVRQHGGRRTVALFGASTAGAQLLLRLRLDPDADVQYFIDNSPQKWLQTLAGLPIRRPEPAAFAGVDLIVVSSVHAAAITQQVVDAGYAHKLVIDASRLAPHAGDVSQPHSEGAEHERPLSQQERLKYEQMWAFAEYRADHVLRHVKTALELMAPSPGDSIIDFGAGEGLASARFQDEGLRVLALDIAANAMAPQIAERVTRLIGNLWELPVELLGDWGFCCDVMEHIPPAHVDDVLAAIRRCTKRATFFNISLRPDDCGRLIGKTLHLTVRPTDWWVAALHRHWTRQHIVAEVVGDSLEVLVD